VDVVQTIAELGGADVPEDWDGDSMLRWLDNPRSAWKDLAVCEYYGHNVASGSAMIRIGRYKYVYHAAADADHPAEKELYDMLFDPGEFANLAGQRRHSRRIRQMHGALVREIGEDPEVTERRCRSDGAKGYSRSDTKKKQQKT
jgi:arylsulfatase A-like enzyme